MKRKLIRKNVARFCHTDQHDVGFDRREDDHVFHSAVCAPAQHKVSGLDPVARLERLVLCSVIGSLQKRSKT